MPRMSEEFINDCKTMLKTLCESSESVVKSLSKVIRSQLQINENYEYQKAFISNIIYPESGIKYIFELDLLNKTINAQVKYIITIADGKIDIIKGCGNTNIAEPFIIEDLRKAITSFFMLHYDDISTIGKNYLLSRDFVFSMLILNPVEPSMHHKISSVKIPPLLNTLEYKYGVEITLSPKQNNMSGDNVIRIYFNNKDNVYIETDEAEIDEEFFDSKKLIESVIDLFPIRSR